jgi:two-component system alkaline phosphatase synthesis response regulator PhoP
LLVDDNPDLLESIRFAISTLGDGDLRVETATDGAHGLERVYELHPDCVVVDVKMPNMNGYQMVLALRGDPETASIPLVLLSALVQDHDQAAGMLAGADQYLTKPTPPRKILEAIYRCIRLTEQERQQRLENLATQRLEGDDEKDPFSSFRRKDEPPPTTDGIWQRR